MSDVRRFFARLGRFLRPSRAERELGREVQAHLAMLEEAHRANGLTAEEAQRVAVRELRAEGVKDMQRDARSFPWLEDARQDVRQAIRALARTPTFASVAILTLALGIGVNSAVFSVINAVLLRPLPYRDAERLVTIWAVPPNQPLAVARATAPEFLAWQREATLFEVMGTEGRQERDLGGGDNGEPAERVSVQRLQSSLFDVLGVQPALGRAFRPDEELVGAPAPVAILSDSLWRRRYNRDPNVLSKVLPLNGVPTTIVGVMPPAFAYLSVAGQIDVFVPFAFNRAQVQGSGRGYAVAARMKLGVTIAEAQAEMDAVVARIADELPEPSKGWHARVQPLQEALYGGYRPGLMLLEGIVALVLLIACANVAALLVARAMSRTTEIAVRAAIGAGRSRIVRQLLTESALLSVLGGFAGILVAWVTLQGLVVVSPAWLPPLSMVDIDGRVLAFTLVVSLVTGLVFGGLPALQASRPDLVDSLRATTKGATDAIARHRLRNGLVVVQIALAVVLLVAAGLATSTFVRLKTADLGVDQSGVMTFTLSFQGTGFFQPVGNYRGYPLINVHPTVALTTERVWNEVQRLPGVLSAAAINAPPFSGPGALMPFAIEGQSRQPGEGERQTSAHYHVVTPGFFSTMRIPIVQGRDFNERDRLGSPWTIIVNETMAKAFWPGQEPVSARLTLDIVTDEQPREVIGVVRDTPASVYDPSPGPAMYVPYTQLPPHTIGPTGTNARSSINFVVRAVGNATEVVPGIHRVMREVDRDRPITDVRPLGDVLSATLDLPRYSMTLFALFAGLATLLATIGIYGVVSYGVSQRTREIGIRMALGAAYADVRALILRDVLVIATVGLVIGFVGAVWLARSVTSFYFGVTATDPITYASVAVLMLAVAVLAAWIPTQRAIRVAPTVALRSE